MSDPDSSDGSGGGGLEPFNVLAMMAGCLAVIMSQFSCIGLSFGLLAILLSVMAVLHPEFGDRRAPGAGVQWWAGGAMGIIAIAIWWVLR